MFHGYSAAVDHRPLQPSAHYTQDFGEVPPITVRILSAIVLIDRAPYCFSPNSCVKYLFDRTCSTGSWNNEKAEHPPRIHFFLMRLLQSYLILTFLAFVLPAQAQNKRSIEFLNAIDTGPVAITVWARSLFSEMGAHTIQHIICLENYHYRYSLSLLA
jgi:hypothetical protein